ncbi:hypothetical protein FNF28_07416 [Cafeteria roenbergensis]|nr:hypothetical protein FNF28_07416 [Cafeteria roenbergensis]
MASAEQEAAAARETAREAAKAGVAVRSNLTRKLRTLAAEFKAMQRKHETEQQRRVEAEAAAEEARAEADSKVAAAHGAQTRLEASLKQARVAADDDAAQLRLRRERAEAAEAAAAAAEVRAARAEASAAKLIAEKEEEERQAAEWESLEAPAKGQAPPMPPGAEATVMGEWAAQVATNDDDKRALQKWLSRAAKATRKEAQTLAVRRVQRVDESQAENFRLLIMPSLADSGRRDVRVYAWWKREKRIIAKLRLATVVLPEGVPEDDERAWAEAAEEARARVVGTAAEARGAAAMRRAGGGAAAAAAFARSGTPDSPKPRRGEYQPASSKPRKPV